MRYIVFSDYNIIETEIKFFKRQKIWQRQIGSYQIPIRADKLFLMISKLTNRIDLSKYPSGNMLGSKWYKKSVPEKEKKRLKF